MAVMNATNARKNLYKIIEEVNDGSEPVTITNANGKNAVLISESDWKAVQETLFLLSVPGYADSIKKVREEDVKKMPVYDPDEEW